MKRKRKEKKSLGPITMSFLLILFLCLITGTLALINLQGQSPVINNGVLESVLVSMQNILSLDGIKALCRNLTMNFQAFEPLVYMVISLMGTSILYRSGILKHIAKVLKRIKPLFLTFFLLFLTIASTYFGNIGFIYLMPIVGIIYQYMGRNPIIGLLTVFLGYTLGQGAGICYNYQDYYLGIMTQMAATVDVDKAYQYQLLSTLYISLFATGVLSVLITYFIENKIVPKLSNPASLEDELVIDKKAARLTAGVFFILILVLIYLIFPGFSFSGFLLDKTEEKYLVQLLGSNSPFALSLPYLISFLCMICGFVYGRKTGNLKNSQDFNEGLSSAFDKTGYLFVLLFFGSVLISILEWSNLPTVLASRLLDFMSVLEFSGMPLIFVTFVIFLFLALLYPNPSANWITLSPIVVPLLMRANITPEYTQYLFTVTNGIASSLSIFFPYYFVLLGLYYKFNKNESSISFFKPLKMIFSVSFPILGIWLLLVVGWFLIGLPLGVGSFPTL